MDFGKQVANFGGKTSYGGETVASNQKLPRLFLPPPQAGTSKKVKQQGGRHRRADMEVLCRGVKRYRGTEVLQTGWEGPARAKAKS
jgi:hypothetical protein